MALSSVQSCKSVRTCRLGRWAATILFRTLDATRHDEIRFGVNGPLLSSPENNGKTLLHWDGSESPVGLSKEARSEFWNNPLSERTILLVAMCPCGRARGATKR